MSVKWKHGTYTSFATVDGIRVFMRFVFYGPPRRGGEWEYGEVGDLGELVVQGSQPLRLMARLDAENLTWRRAA